MRSHGKPVLNRLWSKNLLISLPWSLVGVEENVLALHENRLISIYTTNSTMANTANYNPNWTKQYLKSRKEEGKTVGYFQIWCKVARVYSKYIRAKFCNFLLVVFFLHHSPTLRNGPLQKTYIIDWHLFITKIQEGKDSRTWNKTITKQTPKNRLESTYIWN